MFKPHSLAPPELFIACSELVRPATTPFYAKLDQTLDSFDFATQARTPKDSARFYSRVIATRGRVLNEPPADAAIL